MRRGDFVLKSGRRSDWFIDAKQTTCRPDGMLLVAEALLAVLPDEVTALGGLTMGADAAAFATAGIAATRGRPLKAFSVRKEAKDHGGGGRLAGALDPGDKVAITEDAVTRGVSMLEAAEVVRACGAEPVLLVPVVDRGGTVTDLAAEQGLAVRALVTAPDLGLPVREGRGADPLGAGVTRCYERAPAVTAGRWCTTMRTCSSPSSTGPRTMPAPAAQLAGRRHLAVGVEPPVAGEHERVAHLDGDPLRRRGQGPQQLERGDQHGHALDTGGLGAASGGGGGPRRGRQLDLDADLLAQALGLAGQGLDELVVGRGGAQRPAVGRHADDRGPPPRHVGQQQAPEALVVGVATRARAGRRGLEQERQLARPGPGLPQLVGRPCVLGAQGVGGLRGGVALGDDGGQRAGRLGGLAAGGVELGAEPGRRAELGHGSHQRGDRHHRDEDDDHARRR